MLQITHMYLPYDGLLSILCSVFLRKIEMQNLLRLRGWRNKSDEKMKKRFVLLSILKYSYVAIPYYRREG